MVIHAYVYAHFTKSSNRNRHKCKQNHSKMTGGNAPTEGQGIRMQYCTIGTLCSFMFSANKYHLEGSSVLDASFILLALTKVIWCLVEAINGD